ncbi:MAG TPA: phospholipid-binding protein [Drouetiella sp.]|jgi:hypothetical protein
MGWLDRLFKHDQPAAQQPAASPVQTAPAPMESIPAERVGLMGEYDQSGLAKRVAKAFDDAGLDDHQTVWIAQTSATVVLKGKTKDQATLDKMVAVAKSVEGTKAVDTTQVHVGA